MNCLTWIESLPASWTAKPLRAIADYLVSNVDKVTADDELPVRLCNYTEVYNNEFITLSLPFMNATATAEEITKFRILVDDVLITKDSESWDDIGVPALVKETSDDLLCGYHLALIRLRDQQMDSRFLLRCLQAKPVRIQLELASNGVTRFGIPKSDIGGLKLPVPPLPQQRAIADLLDRETKRLDDLLNAKEHLLTLLSEKHRALVTIAVTRGLDPNASLRDSGVPWLGKIPAHWSVKRVKYIFNLVSEPAPKDNDFELLSLYTDIGVRPRKELEARGNKASTTDNYWKVKPGDLVVNKLLAWMGAFGVSEYEGVTSPAYDILRPNPHVDPFYYHHLFRSGICLPEIRRRSYGIMNMRLRLYFDRFGDMSVPAPPYSEQVQIVEAISVQNMRFHRIKEALERTIDLLKERRAALISAAVIGQLSLTEP